MTNPRGRNLQILRLALSCGVTLAAVACSDGLAVENPAGYPPIPLGRAAAPAPTPGGAPAPVGASQQPGGGEAMEGESQEGTAGAAAVGPVAGNSGLYETMSGAGSASVEPEPEATPAPQPVATVTVLRESGFEPAELTIRRGDAVLWRNEGRSPQTVTGDPALAANPGHALLPPDAQPWGSPVLNYGDSYIQAFDVAGEYTYFSMPFEGQGAVGRIIVR